MQEDRALAHADASVAAERRRFARMKQLSLHSTVGPVIDISRTGMRVESRRRLRGTVNIILFNVNGPDLELKARVVWTKRLGFRRHLAGLEFVGLTPAVSRELVNIGTSI